MAFETKQYVIDLAKLLNLKNMDDARRARLEDLVKKGVATKDQKKWWALGKTGMDWEAPNIDAKTPADPTTTPPTPETYTYTGEIVGAAGVRAPSANDLEELYKKLVVILRDVAADEELRENDPTKKFLDTFYGAGKAVEPYTITPLVDAPGIADYIQSNLKDFARFFQNEIKEVDLSNLANKLNDGSYVSNTKALKTLKSFLDKISYYYMYGGDKSLPATNIPSCLGTASGTPPVVDLDTASINIIIDCINTPTPPASFDTFKDDAPKLFGKLVTNDKLREKVLAKDEDGDITKWINKGLSETAYKEGDNALAPKFEDRKRFFKRAKENIQEKYDDTLGKLKNKHKRHIYSTNARYVVEQLLEKNIDPTSGMEKLTSTLGAIMGDLPNPVQKQVKWVKEKLDTLSSNDFFKDALRDGKQMRQLVQQIIIDAAHEDKKTEAKVALEMLSVMRYTMTTSSIRDKLKKESFTIFSDGSLSFNKDGGGLVQTFTKATDKLIKTMAMGAFELGNLAKNAINTNGVKFKQGTGHLNERTTKSEDYKDPDKKATMEELFAFWDFVNSSQQSKDYNIFKSHEKVQDAADNKTGNATASVTTSGGTTYEIKDPTLQDEKFLEYLLRNNIGRAA